MSTPEFNDDNPAWLMLRLRCRYSPYVRVSGELPTSAVGVARRLQKILGGTLKAATLVFESEALEGALSALDAPAGLTLAVKRYNATACRQGRLATSEERELRRAAQREIKKEWADRTAQIDDER